MSKSTQILFYKCSNSNISEEPKDVEISRLTSLIQSKKTDIAIPGMLETKTIEDSVIPDNKKGSSNEESTATNHSFSAEGA